MVKSLNQRFPWAFPSENKHQTLRMARFYGAVATYLVAFALHVTSALFGYIQWQGIWMMSAAALFVNLVVYLLIRSDLNLRFKDPSLTKHQIYACLLVTLFHYTTPTAKRVPCS